MFINLLCVLFGYVIVLSRGLYWNLSDLFEDYVIKKLWIIFVMLLLFFVGFGFYKWSNVNSINFFL